MFRPSVEGESAQSAPNGEVTRDICHRTKLRKEDDMKTAANGKTGRKRKTSEFGEKGILPTSEKNETEDYQGQGKPKWNICSHISPFCCGTFSNFFTFIL